MNTDGFELFYLNYHKQSNKYSGWTAQIIQHELDHVAGIVI
ncbi:MAG: peptide deformylase [Lachnospiraceae bacterium]|nr:peptide deformylase [Lachnospiraceae bacterium]